MLVMPEEKTKLIVVTGAGGFIGGSLVAALRARGQRKIRAVDVKPLEDWYQKFGDVENLSLDLNLKGNCEIAAAGAAEIYNLAANMGGMGFIENNKALCMLSVLINTHMLQAALKHGVERYFYASSACVYNADKQRSFEAPSLKEEDAYPAMAEDGYGWEKLFSERMCRHFREDYGFTTSMAPGAPGTAAAKKRLRQSAEKSSKRSSAANTKSKSGAVANKPGASCTLTTA
jgi:nucleoside-diphosphate-sugar epimerase